VERNKIHTLITEVKILSIIHHPFIITLRVAIQTETHTHLLLEFVNSGDVIFN